jgi:FkbM family methyltransferase
MLILKTAHKMAIARVASSCVLFTRRIRGLSKLAIVKRGGIWWSLDLSEGIDFSIYLLGGFEPKTLKLYSKIVKPGDIVLDIGANIGAHTLPLARLVGDDGKVIAFEPTRYAFEKLSKNIGLNKDLSSRITMHQVMLVAHESESLESEIYSSWPLFDSQKSIHKDHLGQLMETAGAVPMTLDQAIEKMQLKYINFVKIDVDGHEYSVLAGSSSTLSQYRPVILMELAPYLFEKKMQEFEKLLKIFLDLRYSARDANTLKGLSLDPDQLIKLVPVGGSRNILLIPGTEVKNRNNIL